jgi:hypothetical protein
MNKNRIAYILIIASIALLGFNIYNGYNQNNYNYFGIGSNLLLILAMAVIIFQNKKIK